MKIIFAPQPCVVLMLYYHCAPLIVTNQPNINNPNIININIIINMYMCNNFNMCLNTN